ncbi:hypothetical protein LTR65_000669 [Meristemomyces frigidus]
MDEGDEVHRMARLIRFLGQEAVLEFIEPRHEVNTRIGASLMYEIVLSATLWIKQQAAE